MCPNSQAFTIFRAAPSPSPPTIAQFFHPSEPHTIFKAGKVVYIVSKIAVVAGALCSATGIYLKGFHACAGVKHSRKPSPAALARVISASSTLPHVTCVSMGSASPFAAAVVPGSPSGAFSARPASRLPLPLSVRRHHHVLSAPPNISPHSKFGVAFHRLLFPPAPIALSLCSVQYAGYHPPIKYGFFPCTAH